MTSPMLIEILDYRTRQMMIETLKKQKSEKKFSILQFRPKPERDMKIIFWGADQVGKSALLVRFVTGRYISEYSSLTNFTVTKTITPTESDVDVKLEVTDPISCETSGLLKKSSFDLLLLVFDITNAESFRWIKERADKLKQDRRNNGVVLLGNKKDLSSRREVSTEEARQFSEANAWAYFEVSAAELADSDEEDESQDHDKSVNDALKTAVTELFLFRRNFSDKGQGKKSSGTSKGGESRRRSSTVREYIHGFANHVANRFPLGSRS